MQKAGKLPIAQSYADESALKRALATWRSRHAAVLQESHCKMLKALHFMAGQNIGQSLMITLPPRM